MAEKDDPIARLTCDRGYVSFSDGISMTFSACGTGNNGTGHRDSILTGLRSGPRASPDAEVVPNPRGGREVHVRPGLCAVTGNRAHDTITTTIIDAKASKFPTSFTKYVRVDLACRSDGIAEFTYYTTGDVPADKKLSRTPALPKSP